MCLRTKNSELKAVTLAREGPLCEWEMFVQSEFRRNSVGCFGMEIRRRCFLGKPWFDYPISFILQNHLKVFFNAEVSISESNQAFFPIMSVFSIPISGVNLKQP